MFFQVSILLPKMFSVVLSVDYLEAAFPQLHGRIIGEDFLKMDLKKLYGDRPFCVIGNYPYNISTQIFFKILDYRDQVVCCSGMLQREVAQRIAEPPGSKTYGILSVLLQAWYDIEYLFTVDEHVFNPPPKIKAVMAIGVSPQKCTTGVLS